MNPNGAATAIPMTIGVIGGTLSSFMASLQYADLTETIGLSALGAIISFVVSALLEWIVKKIRRR
jgi:Na+/H+ antiporter NhaA